MYALLVKNQITSIIIQKTFLKVFKKRVYIVQHELKEFFGGNLELTHLISNGNKNLR